jgi:gluconolactonase
MNSVLKLDGVKSALIIQGLQNDVLAKKGVLFDQRLDDFMAKQNTLANIRDLCAAIRSAGGLVFHVLYVVESDGLGQPATAPVFHRFRESGAIRRGSWGAKPFDDFPLDPKDIIVEKCRVNPFYGSMLPSLLRGRGITTVLPVGTLTNMGIVAAARYAADDGYEVIVPSDAAATHDDDRQRATIEYALKNVATVATTAEIVGALGAK